MSTPKPSRTSYRLPVQDAWLNSPWRAEPLYELAKWHDTQLRNCTPGNVECENKHHMGAFLNAKMVRCVCDPSSSLPGKWFKGVALLVAGCVCSCASQTNHRVQALQLAL